MATARSRQRARCSRRSQRPTGRRRTRGIPPVETYEQLLSAAGFSLSDGWCRLLNQRRPFADEAAIRSWVRPQVLIAYAARLDPAASAAFSTEAEECCVQALRRSDGTSDQDYGRIDVLARKG